MIVEWVFMAAVLYEGGNLSNFAEVHPSEERCRAKQEQFERVFVGTGAKVASDCLPLRTPSPVR